MYFGKLMWWATITVSWLAMPARNTSAFVVTGSASGDAHIDFEVTDARSTIVLVL